MSPDNSVKRPYPVSDNDSAFYWRAAKEHRLEIARCRDCRFFIHPPRGVCPRCWSERIEGEAVSGQGTIYTFATCYLAERIPGFDVLPYANVIVELEEQPGLRLLTNLLDCPVDEIRIGMPVEVTFEAISDEIALPQFRPANPTVKR